MVAERAHPCDTELGERDVLTVRYGRQTVHELEVMSDVLCDKRIRQRQHGNARLACGDGGRSHLVLETAERAPEIAFLKVVTALDLAREQSTPEWAVWVQEVVAARRERGVLTSMR